MSSQKFVYGLVFTVLLSFGICGSMEMLISDFTYFDMTIISIAFFSVLSILVFILSIRAINSADKNFFMFVIFMNVMIKIVLSITIVGLYVYITDPANKLFIIPFLVVYILFTIFETYFLSCQSRVTK